LIRSLCLTPDEKILTGLAPDALRTILQTPGALLWVDIVDEPVENAAHILRDIFGFHPLAVDDALEESHSPKVDDWGDYLYLVLHALHFKASFSSLDTLELDIFVNQSYMVTYQAQPLTVVEQLWVTYQRDVHYLKRGTMYLLYRLTDDLVSDYMPIVEAIDETVDQMEDQIFAGPTTNLLERIFALKRATLHLRRILGPQRETINKLARGDYDVVGHAQSVFFRDVYDHLVRMYDITDSMRDLVGGALEMYLSVVNNRMNEVMKTLTIITTLFMPLSFIVGFFGMNFFQPSIDLPAWTGAWAFGLMLASILLIPVGMYRWMHKRAWM